MTTPTKPRPLFFHAAAAVLCAGLGVDVQARAPRTPRAASTPSTAQVLAPSAATVPDALPPDKVVYRCGNSYSAQPCGDAAPLEVADARSPAQRLQAEDVAARDKRLASWLEAGRHEREHVAPTPDRSRAARSPAPCVDTAAITCMAKKPRPRHAVGKVPKAASSAGNAKG